MLCMVARDLGIPVIANVHGLLRRVSSGQRLRLDATSQPGRVELADQASFSESHTR